MKTLYLKSNEERRLQAGHLWVYSNEIDVSKSPLQQFVAGELVQLISSRNKSLGIGYINPNNLLCVRLLTTHPNIHIDTEFFHQRIQQALKLREQLFDRPFYRLVYGEGDYLPGLIIDRYDDIFVIQINTMGMQQLQEPIIAALQSLFKPKAVLLRNDSSMRKLEGLECYVTDAVGTTPDVITIEENNLSFKIPVREGQKTGWFYDHRVNRAQLQHYVKNKQVLDVFCYLGGWGIQAAACEAAAVTCLDSSALALAFVKQNAQLNNVESKIQTVQADAFDQLKTWQAQQRKFDVIVLDPPAFIKKRKDIKTGFAAYLRLNELAMQLLNEDGFLVTASCSLHLSKEMLMDVVRRAALNTKHQVQVFAQGQQGPDHPVHPAIAETEYLKTLFCRVF